MQWYHDVCDWQRKLEHTRDENGIFGGVSTGSVKAYNSIAYDLYTLEHLSLLEPSMLRRLKHSDQFQGMRYELYVIATLLRAGFEVELEDERDGSRTHCELAATHKVSGRTFSVEAKARGRPGMLGKQGEGQAPEDIRANIYGLLQRALLKEADHDLIVFLDVNMPPDDQDLFEKEWFQECVHALRKLEENQSDTDPYPPAFIILTNYPYHYVGNDGIDPGQTSFLTAINRPEFTKAVNVEKCQQMHPEIGQLWFSVLNHSKIPERFDD